MLKTHGIHHVTSVAGEAQQNLDFNAGILALRLVKKTLNFDDRHVYHLYFGNDQADTGITTTFPVAGAKAGVIGGGQVRSVQYAIRPGQTRFWAERLNGYGIATARADYLDQTALTLKDPSGLELEMIETAKGPANGWSFGGVEGDGAVIGIHAATLASVAPGETLKLLTGIMGYSVEAEDDEYYRLKVHDGLGGLLYLNKIPAERGRYGKGTVHHIAFMVKDEEIAAWQEHLAEKGYRPTEIRDRKYFRSIYFREKGGILFEFATQGPGFFIDEEEASLGEKLMIPPHYEANADEILKDLKPIVVRPVAPEDYKAAEKPASSEGPSIAVNRAVY